MTDGGTGQTETTFTVAGSSSTDNGGGGHNSGVVSVQYETREGSGKNEKDYMYAQGTLVRSLANCVRCFALV